MADVRFARVSGSSGARSVCSWEGLHQGARLRRVLIRTRPRIGSPSRASSTEDGSPRARSSEPCRRGRTIIRVVDAI